MSPDNWDLPLDEPPASGNDVERLKWGWNELDGASAWKVSGPGDGRPYHEEQLEQAWGRKPDPALGDVFGIATITPEAEDRHALVSISAYFGGQVPTAILRWFKDAYPGAEFR